MTDVAHQASDSIPATPDEMVGDHTLGSPASPNSADSSEASTPLDAPQDDPISEVPKRMPSLRSVSEPQHTKTPAVTLTRDINSARRPTPAAMGGLPEDLMKKMSAFSASRMGPSMNRPPMSTGNSAVPIPSAGGMNPPMGMGMGGTPGGLRMPALPGRPGLSAAGAPRSAPQVPMASKGGLAGKRGFKMNLSDASGPPAGPGKLNLNGAGEAKPRGPTMSQLDEYKKYIDQEKGWITFEGAATITNKGVNFANGNTFSISLDEVQLLEELGKGNYGVVYRVRHAKPKVPRFGQGFSGVQPISRQNSAMDSEGAGDSSPLSPVVQGASASGKIMAMKEIRLQLEEAKFTTILKELVILHQCVSPYIIDFYGAFFQEGAVYMCIEYMDGGSIDKLYAGGIPENVLRKITYSTVMGLKCLKDEHQIIHRDVKPTNILANSRGQVKICDFGVSGDLVASMAKTNIGCQSYMAPERISGGGFAQQAGNTAGTYSVQSDIWSLGLTIIECALGKYPYPPEISSSIYSQLSAIVDGEPPNMPTEGYSENAQDFVQSCLHKNPHMRLKYDKMLIHPWLAALSKPETIAEEAEDEAAEISNGVGNMNLTSGTEDAEVAEWVKGCLDRKKSGTEPAKDEGAKPALHAAPLDSVSPAVSPLVG